MRFAALALLLLALPGCANFAVGETRRNVTAFCVGADGHAYAIATQVSTGDRRSDRACRHAVARLRHDPGADLSCRMMEFSVTRDR